MLRRTPMRLVAGAVAALALVAGPTGCSSGQTDQPAAGSAEFNQPDVDFATAMSPHHMQAAIMAELAETRAGSAEVKELATQIRAAQEPEIDQLAAWILDWGSRGGSMPPHGDGHTGPGMLTEGRMNQLREAKGAEFDRLFLEGMIVHHEGAIEMAQTELANGLNPDAKAMAQSIITSQQAEIDQMQQFLADS